MGGVYRIQIFFGFLYFFYIYKAPYLSVGTCRHLYITCLQVLSEAYRVLKPGGRFMCLEFSRVTNPLFRS